MSFFPQKITEQEKARSAFEVTDGVLLHERTECFSKKHGEKILITRSAILKSPPAFQERLSGF